MSVEDFDPLSPAVLTEVTFPNGVRHVLVRRGWQNLPVEGGAAGVRLTLDFIRADVLADQVRARERAEREDRP